MTKTKTILALVLCLSLAACTADQILADINILIQIAGAIVPVVTPLLGSNLKDTAEVTKLSALATKDITAVLTAYQAYKASKAIADLQTLEAAIQAVRWDLTQELAANQLDPATDAKVTAWVNLIATTLDAVLAQLPSIKFKAVHIAIILPTPEALHTRWNNEVCSGDQRCTAMVRVRRSFWASLGNAAGEAKFGGN